MKVGIIGAGSIGSAVAKAIHCGSLRGLELAAVCDVDADKANNLLQQFAPQAQILSLEKLLASVDIAVECAAGQVVPTIVRQATECFQTSNAPTHVLVMSVGGLLGLEFADDGPAIHAPSGAIGGLDAIKAMREGGLHEVVLTTRKPPAGLGLEITEEQVLFDGFAAEVVKLYPKNINVAMALSLAGLGAEKTRVRLIADPAVSKNTHHVLARGEAGEVEFTSRNMPFPENPRTSYLAALSAISVLRSIGSSLKVG